MSKEFDECCGWSNHKTWNVALWCQNDPEWYDAVKEHATWHSARASLKADGIWQTPDGVSITDDALDESQLTDMVGAL